MTSKEGLKWQIGVWDRMSDLYAKEIDKRFAGIVGRAVDLAELSPGMDVLDLGTGTGAVAIEASTRVGRVAAVDPSPEMLEIARRRVAEAGIDNVMVLEGRAEEIPAAEAEFDALIACLSLMYAIDRTSAARECARVLRPGARFVAVVWAGPDDADIVRLQQTAGSFAPQPPVPGVGPGAMADTGPFIEQLRDAGIDAEVRAEDFTFDFDDFESAWTILAGVTTAQLTPERREEAKTAVRELMWPDGEGPRRFTNKAQLIVGERR